MRIQKDVFLQPLALPTASQGVCQRREITVSIKNGLLGLFCYVRVFRNFTDPVVPTLRGASGGLVTAYAY